MMKPFQSPAGILLTPPAPAPGPRGKTVSNILDKFPTFGTATSYRSVFISTSSQKAGGRGPISNL